MARSMKSFLKGKIGLVKSQLLVDDGLSCYTAVLKLLSRLNII